MLSGLVTAAVVALWVLAGTYQPIQFGDESGSKRGVFTMAEGIQNTGPETVTIQAVSILSPQEQTDGIAPWPLTPAGQAQWQQRDIGPGVPSAGPVSGIPRSYLVRPWSSGSRCG